MNLRNLLALGLVTLSLTTVAVEVVADDDPVIMTVGGVDVPRSEFEYSYYKNNSKDVIDRKSVNGYLELFVNYKRKVLAALDAHLDTLTSYNKEFRQYRDQQVLPTLISDAELEEQAQKIYRDTKDRIGPDGLIDVSHILIRVGQNDSADVMAAAKVRADSVYDALQKGADFATLAQKVSQDPGTAPRGGVVGRIQRGQTLQNFEDAAFKLKDGEVSQPVLTEVGYHIIKMHGHHEMAPYDSLRAEIYTFIERRNIREILAKNRVKAIAEAKSITEQQVMDGRADSISALDQNMKYLIKEYHDGLLLFEISSREVWEKASKDSIGQETFFKKNRKKYAWDAPRFKGVAYNTRDAADVEAVKKCLKKQKWADWAPVLRTTFNNDSVLRIKVEKGIFKKGDNGLVDRDVFKQSDATPKEVKDFPCTGTYGRVIKAPEEVGDVRKSVIADYQDQLEQQWLKDLEARYPVTVNEDVLKTVREKAE